MMKPPPRKPARWYENGDHPLDFADSIRVFGGDYVSGEDQRLSGWEGQRVRRYRNPFQEEVLCHTCLREWDEHGWVDYVDGVQIDYTVCPGTTIEYIDRYVEAVLEARG